MSTEDEDPVHPHLRVIEGGGTDPRDEDRARLDLKRSLVELTANLLRVARGAGRPETIIRDCYRVIEASAGYEEAFGKIPNPAEVQNCILYQEERGGSEGAGERGWAIERMTRGALQYVASKMMRQLPQTRTGEHDMTCGAVDFVKARDEERRRLLAGSAKQKLAKAKKPPTF